MKASRFFEVPLNEINVHTIYMGIAHGKSSIFNDDEYTLAKRYSISELTVSKWKKRDGVEDHSHIPHCLQTTLSPAQEAVAVLLQKTLFLPLDDLLSVVRELGFVE